MSLTKTTETIFGRPVPQTPAVQAYIANLDNREDQTKARRLFMLLAENYRQAPTAASNQQPGRQWHSLDLGEAFLRPAANTRNEKRVTSLKRKINTLNKADGPAAIESLKQAVDIPAPSTAPDTKLAR
ncbi:MAG: hypothetical protein ACQEQL_03880 [Pseudomonadota bacterium]